MQWSLHDLLCTATHFVAQGISGALRRLLPADRPPQRVILSGGGTRNGLLWHLLEQQLGGVTLERTDRHGIPADAAQGDDLRHSGGADGRWRAGQRAVGDGGGRLAPAGQPDAGVAGQLVALPGVDGGSAAAAGAGVWGMTAASGPQFFPSQSKTRNRLE